MVSIKTAVRSRATPAEAHNAVSPARRRTYGSRFRIAWRIAMVTLCRGQAGKRAQDCRDREQPRLKSHFATIEVRPRQLSVEESRQDGDEARTANKPAAVRLTGPVARVVIRTAMACPAIIGAGAHRVARDPQAEAHVERPAVTSSAPPTRSVATTRANAAPREGRRMPPTATVRCATRHTISPRMTWVDQRQRRSARLVTYRRIFSSVPQISMEHQRRLWFFERSTNSQGQATHRLSRCISGPMSSR